MRNGVFTLDDTENDTETDIENNNYGFHYQWRIQDFPEGGGRQLPRWGA